LETGGSIYYTSTESIRIPCMYYRDIFHMHKLLPVVREFSNYFNLSRYGTCSSSNGNGRPSICSSVRHQTFSRHHCDLLIVQIIYLGRLRYKIWAFFISGFTAGKSKMWMGTRGSERDGQRRQTVASTLRSCLTAKGRHLEQI